MINKKQKKPSARPVCVLMLGAYGLVGSFISKSFGTMAHYKLFTPKKNEVNITDKESLYNFVIKYSPSIVINFAAYTNLSETERQRGNKNGTAWLINVDGLKNLLEVCENRKIFLIHISTDAVFPGTNNFPGPYPENAIPPNTPKPLSWYGYTKLQEEIILTNSKTKHTLIRISYPFGNKFSRKDFASKVIEYIKNGLPLFSDQEFTPTYLPDLAKAILKIASKEITGTFHVATHPVTTPYQFATRLAKSSSFANKVKGSSIEKYLKTPRAVPRLIHGGLSTSKTETKLTIRFHSWKEAVDKFTKKAMF